MSRTLCYTRSWCVIKRHVGGNEMSLSSLHYAFVFQFALFIWTLSSIHHRAAKLQKNRLAGPELNLEKSIRRQLFFFYFSLGEHTHYGDTEEENRDTILRLLCSLFPYNILIRRYFLWSSSIPTGENNQTRPIRICQSPWSLKFVPQL